MLVHEAHSGMCVLAGGSGVRLAMRTSLRPTATARLASSISSTIRRCSQRRRKSSRPSAVSCWLKPPSRRRDCHHADALSPSLLKRQLNVEEGAAE